LYGENLATKDFCSIALTGEGELLSKFLDDEQIPFWVGKVTRDHERQFQTVFGVPMPFPFVALVGNISNSFTVIELITQNMLSRDLVNRLNKGITTYKHHTQKEHDEENARIIQRQITEEQNRAFQRSLDEDAYKEKVRKIQEETKQTSKVIKLVVLQEARRVVLKAKDDLPPEPDVNDKNVKSIRVGIRLPDGSRVERRFFASCTLKMVFDCAAGAVANSVTDEAFLDESSPSLDSEQNVIPWSIEKYELVQNYPKRSFGLQEGSKPLSELNLDGQTMLFLQRKPV